MGYEKALCAACEVARVIRGKDDVIRKILMTILAGGHVLMEDIPGVGKTTMAIAFAKALSLKENRVQFTTDVMPSDIVGFSMLNSSTGSFEYREGAIMCNLFLADEINRTSPKTQAALLEAMEEGQVTVDGISRKLPEPFVVIATQNPAGSAGTQLLPESQLDRFMIRVSMGYPDIKNEIAILEDRSKTNPADDVSVVMDGNEINEMKQEVNGLIMDDAIYEYAVVLAASTRKSPLIDLGVSPRGSLALASMSRAHAYISGRKYVSPDDVQAVFKDVTSHRIVLSTKAKLEGVTADGVLDGILRAVPVPRAVR